MSPALLFLLPVCLLGLCVGSFLNVVIYRLPRELSVAQPRWSFCPHCGRTIRWHDNVPVLSWLLLRGRCRDCAAPISLQYPVVELLTALLFVAVYDALFLGRTLVGVAGVPADAAILLAYWFLFATLLANAVMDVEEYLIDVRLTYSAMAAGVVGHALWAGLRGSTSPTDIRYGAAAVAMTLVTAAMLWWSARRETVVTVDSSAASEEAPATQPDSSDAPVANPPAPLPSGPAPIWLLGLVVASSVAAPFAARFWPPAWPIGPFAGRALLCLGAVYFVLVLALMQPRPADEHLAQALEEERPRARHVAMREMLWLLPIIAAGALAYCCVALGRPSLDWTQLLGPRPSAFGQAVAGGAEALVGLIAGASLGWGVRVFFTLLFGKEAFGTGDIYLLAAIGAVGGPWMCGIAFFAAGPLGVLVAVARKSRRALSFGPILGVGTLVALWLATPVARSVGPALTTLWRIVTRQPANDWY